MTRAIITYAHGAHEELLDIALPVFRDYADLHEYGLVVGENLIKDRGPAWNKVALLREALRTHDEALWLDCDLVITDPSADIADSVPKEYAFALVRHFTQQSEVPNTGVWFCRKSVIPLLDKMLELEVFADHGWWEQAALMTMMGYTVPPQGSDYDRTKCRCVRETQWTRACKFLRVEWNSHPNYRTAKPRIVHCTYPDMLTRIETMRRLVADPNYEYPKWESEAKK